MATRSVIVIIWVLLSAIWAVQVAAQDASPPEGHFIEGDSVKAGPMFRFFINERTSPAPPAGVDPDFLFAGDQGNDCLVIGDMEGYLANDPITGQLERRTFVGDSEEFDYYLHSPEHIDPAQSYPLVVSLHGAGERGDNASPILPNNGAYEFMATASDYDYFMVITQLPANRFWDEPSFRQALLALIASMPEECPVDPSRIYVIGLSMGAFGMWDLAEFAPDMVAAGISIAGGRPGPRELDFSRIADIPFWLFHGSDDEIVPVSESQALVAALEAVGGTFKYTEYEGADHLIWTRTYTNPEVIDWLFSQAKP